MTSCSDVLARIREHRDSHLRDLQTFIRESSTAAQDRSVREYADWLVGIVTIARLIEEAARAGDGSG
jgi:hypothetical protein